MYTYVNFNTTPEYRGLAADKDKITMEYTKLA